MEREQIVTAADLRAAIARNRIRLYVLAYHTRLHPSRLSLLLNERTEMSPDVGRRILRGIERAREDVQDRTSAAAPSTMPNCGAADRGRKPR